MAQNDHGGGCLLFIIDWIATKIRNKRIREHNEYARGVNAYQSMPVGALLPPSSYKDNIIISGGKQGERLHICEQILRNAFNTKHPVILIHAANGVLERIVAGNSFGTVVNDRNKMFDALTSYDFNEIFQIVTETCKVKYDIKPTARYVLQVVYELLTIAGKTPYFTSFANCPYFDLNNTIAKRLSKGSISQSKANELNRLLLTGQAECPKIDTFFSDMKAQIGYMQAQDPGGVGANSVLSSIINQRSLCIDMRSSANVMLMELIVNSLVVAMNRGYDFTLLIDDVAFTNNELLKNAVCQKSNHRNILVSNDLYSLTGGKEDTFSTLVGTADKTVLFAHSSSTSCEKWSRYLGEYEKIDVAENINSGWFQSSRWGYSTNSGQTETLKREHKVKPEQLKSLSQSEAFIYDKRTDDLIQTFIV
jgi:hypothetical protein